jgi:hypothetical protein
LVWVEMNAHFSGAVPKIDGFRCVRHSTTGTRQSVRCTRGSRLVTFRYPAS